jgi:hypothetical protein
LLQFFIAKSMNFKIWLTGTIVWAYTNQYPAREASQMGWSEGEVIPDAD